MLVKQFIVIRYIFVTPNCFNDANISNDETENNKCLVAELMNIFIIFFLA